MSVSIDGKVHRSISVVKYGEPFPVAKRSTERYIESYGHVLIYIIELGQPKWTERLTVEIPMKFVITDIINPSKSYNDSKKRNHLKLIKE